MAKTILLADDSVTIQKVVELTFMDGDYEIVAVSDGLSAVEMLQGSRPDLVIADVHMPGTNGYDVCRQSKAAMPEVPVLLLVGTFEPFDADQAESAGADGHLKKPFDSQVLMARVEELIQRSAIGTMPSVPAISPGETMEPPRLDPPELPTVSEAPPQAPDLHATTVLRSEPTMPQPSPAPEPSVDLGAGFAGPQPTSFAEIVSRPETVASQPIAFETVDKPISELTSDPPATTPNFPEVPFSSEATEEVTAPDVPGLEEASLEDVGLQDVAPEIPSPVSSFVTDKTPRPELVAPELVAPEPVAPEPVAPEPVAAPERIPEPEPVVEQPVAAEASEPPQATAGSNGSVSSNGSGSLSDSDIERIAQRVVELAGEKALKEVAWEVVPDLAEVIIRERIRELESQVE